MSSEESVYTPKEHAAIYSASLTDRRRKSSAASMLLA